MDADIADPRQHRHDDPAAKPLADSNAVAIAQKRLAENLAAALADSDWAEGGLFWAEVDGARLARIETIDRAGQVRERELPARLAALGHDLRVAMAAPGRGAWFSMSLEISASGGLTWRFNFDRRVYDNPASPFTPGVAGAVPDDDAYARDVAAFPRDERHTPLWLRRGASSSAAPYDQLDDAWGWPGVFASIERQIEAARASLRLSPGDDDAPTLTRPEAEALSRQVLSAVVADVLEPHRVATLLGLHAEAVSRRLLPAVPGADDLGPDETLAEARQRSTPALLGVEAGVYGVIGDVVRAHLGV